MPYQSLDDLVSQRQPPRPAHPELGRPPDDQEQEPREQPHLGTLALVQMTVGILGAQLAWTVEMAYGTPYLLSLGLSKPATSLVWMAGPLSGLVVQPIIGALSDAAHHHRFRRRYYILWSAALVVLSTLVVAYARQIAALVASYAGMGDWDPETESLQQQVAIACGIVGFYVLDFSLNGLQASLRALVLDMSPGHLQSVSNAWLGRHTHLGNIIGYLFGYLDLSHSSFLSWLDPAHEQGEKEGSQFRKLAVISLVVMLATIAITCVTQEEGGRVQAAAPKPDSCSEQEHPSVWKRVWQVGADVKHNFRQLPIPVRRVCYVQFFAWTAWFPFLFYATTYVAEELYASLPDDGTPLPSLDAATRSGSFALLLYSLVSLAAGSLLPFLTHLAQPPSPSSSQHRHQQWRRTLPARVGRPGRYLLQKMTPRNFWTIGLGWYAACMALTFWLKGLKGATTVVALAGVPWAITCWVPFALVMESIHELESARTAAATATATERSPSGLSDSQRTAPVPDGNDYGTSSTSSRPRPREGLYPAASAAAAAPFRVTSLRNSSYQPQPSFGSQSLLASSSSVVVPEETRQSSRSPFPNPNPDERTALLPPRSGPRHEEAERAATTTSKPVGGGTILRLHNMAVVLPQFFVALVAAAIFKLTAASRSPSLALALLSRLATTTATSGDDPSTQPPPGAGSELQGQNDVVWVLRFGGLAALIGMVVSRWVCETKSEREYREYLEWGWRRDALLEPPTPEGSGC
ncbi:hypothetical protein JCM8115_007152 [Rhodotorula mucilaginosa]